MIKIEFKNLPDTSTPLNAENLNTLQDNVKNAIDDAVTQVEGEIPTIDSSTSTSSTNPVENQAITNYVDREINTLKNYVDGKGIYESGSNANGSYIKYDDGTMICYKEIDQRISSFYVDSSYYFYNVENIIFPQTFYSKPMVNVSLENASEYRRLNIGGTYNVSTTGIGYITVWNYWNSTNDRVYISIIAIGRWKA